jgi:KDEL-tailed cysteine endopeptidase
LFDRPGSASLQANELPQQGSCGSCWAQSAIGSLEVVLKQARKFREPLSVQQAIDCVKSSESAGCEGGTPMDVLDYFKTHPIATAAEYPYTGEVGECREINPHGQKVYSAGWQPTVPPCTSGACTSQYKYELQILNELSKPGAAALIAYADATNWQNYNQGLFPLDRCSSHSDNGNHVVQLTGWGVETVPNPTNPGQTIKVGYWRVRNSVSAISRAHRQFCLSKLSFAHVRSVCLCSHVVGQYLG